jgi:short-subunit dehydrogenase
MTSERVAEQGYQAVMSGKSIIINGWLNRFFALISKSIPTKITKRIGKYLTNKRLK